MIFDAYPCLENDRLLLHKPQPGDVPALEDMLREAEVYRYEPTFLPEKLSADARAFIERDCDRLFAEKSAILLGIYAKAEPDRFLGLAELYGWTPVRDKISIGYRLRKEYWNRGIATSVVALLRDYILHDLHMQRITAHVRTENAASAKCLLTNGFVQRREAHKEDWGFAEKTIANKYVIYPTKKHGCESDSSSTQREIF